jgi:AraC-like DNA-binding protein
VKLPLGKIRELLGGISPEQLRYVDCFVGRNIGLFLPVGGPCFFALTPRHSHPSYMFILSFDGRTEMRVDGKTISALPGKLLALSPGIEHQEIPSENPPRYIAVFLEDRFFEEQRRHYPGAGNRSFRGESFDPVPDLSPLLKSFMIEADNSAPGSEAVMAAQSLQICHALIRSTGTYLPARDRFSSRMEIDRVIEYMHAHPGEKITVEKLAGIARMSPSHMTRVFRKETGSPPIEYLIAVRLERAKKMLLAGDRTVTEIALDCGFGSAAYLSARFSKTYGTSPSSYRKNAGAAASRNNKVGC